MNKIFGILFLIFLNTKPACAAFTCIDCSEDSILTYWKHVKTSADSLYFYVVSIDNGDFGGSIYNYPEHEIKEIEALVKLNNKLKLIDVRPYQLIRDGLVLWGTNHPLDAINKFEDAITIFDKEKKILGDLSLLNKLRSYFSNAGLSEARYQYYLVKLNQYRKDGPVENTAVCYHALAGYFLNHRNDYNLAINNYLKASEIFRTFSEYGYVNEITICGLSYYMWGNNSKARQYLEQAKPLIEKTRRWNLAIISKNLLAEIDIADENFDNALLKINESLKIADTCGVKTFQAITLATKGNIQLHMKQYEAAFQTLTVAIAMKDSFSIKPNTAEGFFEGGYYLYRYYLIKKNPFKAEETLLQALEEAEANNANLLILKYRKELISFYNQTGEFRKAAAITSRFLHLQDSLQSSQNEFNIASYENEKLEREKEIEVLTLNKDKEVQASEIRRQKLLKNSYLIGFCALLLFSLIIVWQRNKIRKEKIRSDELLLNILPSEVADELKVSGTANAKQFDQVTVMFTDFKNFTRISEKLSPTELVTEIDSFFKAFDHIITRYKIEKIKTIGDSYMCAGGLPVPNSTHAVDVIRAALEIRHYMLEHSLQRKKENKEPFEIRIGINTGPVVAGIVGVKKFAYDIWGDTVNIASRMESSGETGQINISGNTYALVKDYFSCTYRGKIQAKNKGEIDMFFVNALIN